MPITIRSFVGEPQNRVTNIRSTWIDEEHIVHVGAVRFKLVKRYSIRFLFGIFHPLRFERGKRRRRFSMVWLGQSRSLRQFSQHLVTKEPDMLFVVEVCFSLGLAFGNGTPCGGTTADGNPLGDAHTSSRGNHDMDHACSPACVDLPRTVLRIFMVTFGYSSQQSRRPLSHQ